MSQRVQKSLLGVFLRSVLDLYFRELLQWSASGSDVLSDTESFRTVLEEIAKRAMFRKGLRIYAESGDRCKGATVNTASIFSLGRKLTLAGTY